MGMTIDDHIAQLKKLKSFHNGSYGENINFAIDIMRRYEKIQEVMDEKERLGMIREETKQLKLHPCYCGGEMKIEKVAQNGGMDGTYFNWELTCNKCGLTKTYAADNFYNRKYKTYEEVVNDWNSERDRNELKYYCEEQIMGG